MTTSSQAGRAAEIDALLEEARSAWLACAEQRLGQLISNAAFFGADAREPLAVTDDAMLTGLHHLRQAADDDRAAAKEEDDAFCTSDGTVTDARRTEIDTIVAALRKAWRARPELRLGQIVSGAVASSGVARDPFQADDHAMLRGLARHAPI